MDLNMVKNVVSQTIVFTKKSINDDGTFEYRSNRTDQVVINADFTMTGESEKAKQLILKFQFNSSRYISIRKTENDFIQFAKHQPEHIRDCLLVFQRNILEVKNFDMLANSNSRFPNQLLLKLLFSNVITIVEALLSDLLISAIKNNDSAFISLLTRSNKFKNHQIKTVTLVAERKSPLSVVVEALNNMVFHNFQAVQELYESTFGIEFPNIEHLVEAADKRHDIVHRNGRLKGSPPTQIQYLKDIVVINRVDLIKLIEQSEEFVLLLIDKISPK